MKIQNILAQIKGIAKSLILIGKFFLGFVSKYKFYLANAEEHKQIKPVKEISSETSKKGSVASLNKVEQQSTDEEEKPTISLWKYMCWKKESLNKHFTPKKKLNKLFDIERINRILSERAQQDS